MSVTVTYSCNGCEAVETVSGLLRRWPVDRPAAIRVGGVGYDRCVVETPTIESAAPDGWMPFDPYTGVCYCPTCWGEIEPSDAKPEDESASGTPRPETADSSDLCPMGCGYRTEDVAGGPCKRCWDAVHDGTLA